MVLASPNIGRIRTVKTRLKERCILHGGCTYFNTRDRSPNPGLPNRLVRSLFMTVRFGFESLPRSYNDATCLTRSVLDRSGCKYLCPCGSLLRCHHRGAVVLEARMYVRHISLQKLRAVLELP